MDVTDLARLQFAATTLYHFLFVPLTIGLTAVVAGLETAWLRTHKPDYLRLTKFFGRLMLINFAMGVATGIVQEFQFGMNWSDYSRFVGDVFGAPLAIEGLLAFFMESTFLGLWIFGWDRLPRALHATCMWLVHLGTLASAYFILAANSWMQHPVGYTYNAHTGRAELTDFAAVMFNKVQLVAFPHVVLASYMTAGAFVVGIGGWLYLRRGDDHPDRGLFRRAIRIGAAVTLVAGLGVAISGDAQGKVMTEVQPMKMAAAEALYDTEQPASFSVFTLGTRNGEREVWAIKVPRLLSFLATGHFDGRVQGIDQLKRQYQKTYGTDPGTAYYHPGGYVPVIPLTYWSFRYMIGVGVAGAAGALLILWGTRRGRAPTGRWWRVTALAVPVLVLLGSSFGWIFTETGRQPWVVFGLMTVNHAVSPGVTAAEVLTSLIAFTLLYALMAVVEVRLLATYVHRGPEPFEEPPRPTLRGSDDDDAPMAYAY